MSETRRSISRGEFVALVAALATINSMSIDIMLPALPDMGETFAVANPNDRSLVLTVFLLGLGLPQLIFGPLTDRLGRRVPLLVGLAVFTAAAFASLFAPSFQTLLVIRFIQGLGSAVVAVASQSAVRDRYSGSDMAEVMSMVWSVFMIAPIVAPGIGQVILLGGTWELIFVAMGLMGLVCWLWAFIRLPETLPRERRRPANFGAVASGFGKVLTTRTALAYGLAGTFMFSAVLGYVNTAQQLYQDFYGVGAMFAVVFTVAPIASAVAFLLNARVVRIFGMRRIAHTCLAANIVITATWLALSLAGWMPLWLFIVMLALAMLTQGLAWGNLGALAMEPLGHVAGTAAAVFGTAQTVGGAILGYLVAQSFNNTPTPTIAGFFIFGLCVLGCFLIAEAGRLTFGKDRNHPAPDSGAPIIPH